MLNRTKKAFTLLELIVVLLVLGILAAIAVPTFATVKENAAERTFQASADAIARNATAIAASSNDGDNDVSAADITAAAGEAGVSEDGGLLTDAVGGYTCTSMIVLVGGTSVTAGSASCTSN
jgi:prepilin-type N-terminal cleavage/methylation domain-containing protein